MTTALRTSTLAILTAVLLMAGVSAAVAQSGEQDAPPAKAEKAPPTSQAHPALLKPELAKEQAPDLYRVKVETTKGDFVIEVQRPWAPNGADRFYNLVKIGYYEDIAFYRVIDGFMAQCGFHGDPAVNAAWRKANFPDDPIVKDNTRGMVTFAMSSAPNSRTTQLFINFGDNSYLRIHGKFAPFGKVVEGMEVVDQLYAGYGDGAPNGRGPSQGRIASEGNTYLRGSFPKLDYIKRITLLESEKVVP